MAIVAAYSGENDHFFILKNGAIIAEQTWYKCTYHWHGFDLSISKIPFLRV